ncbi:hypothetical protein BN1723_013141 [Verticillium longisporum]|uniref:Uncharacterized protein n=1 Tax=Verticillium longisporum TaxID=100787 RepID=A0A0G4LQ87_VERLO|nr:hypothetical protein BN1723_013141 [Verticillium longisporum]
MGREGGGDSKGASGYRGAADQMVRPTIAVGLRSGPRMAFLKLRSRKKASKDPPRRLRTRRDVGAGKHERCEEGSGEKLRLAAGGCPSWRAGSSDESNKRGGDQCRLLRDALLVLKTLGLSSAALRHICTECLPPSLAWSPRCHQQSWMAQQRRQHQQRSPAELCLKNRACRSEWVPRHRGSFGGGGWPPRLLQAQLQGWQRRVPERATGVGDWHELVVLVAERRERSWRGRDGGEVDVQCPAYAADRGGVVDGSNGQTDACNGWWSGGLGRVPPLPQPKPTTSHEGIGIPCQVGGSEQTRLPRNEEVTESAHQAFFFFIFLSSPCKLLDCTRQQIMSVDRRDWEPPSPPLPLPSPFPPK